MICSFVSLVGPSLVRTMASIPSPVAMSLFIAEESAVSASFIASSFSMFSLYPASSAPYANGDPLPVLANGSSPYPPARSKLYTCPPFLSIPPSSNPTQYGKNLRYCPYSIDASRFATMSLVILKSLDNS